MLSWTDGTSLNFLGKRRESFELLGCVCLGRKVGLAQNPFYHTTHIDPRIQEEELEEIKKLFRFYHKRFWCLKRAHGRFKKMNLLMNCTSSGLVAIGTIAGAATLNPIVLGVISGVGLIVKTANEMKNLKSKI